MTPEQELLTEALFAINNIPNHSNVCKDGSSSYELASKLDRFLKPIQKERDYLNNPDEVVYKGYSFRRILFLALGNGSYAVDLIDRADGEPIEDIIREDLMEGKVIAFNNTYKILN